MLIGGYAFWALQNTDKIKTTRKKLPIVSQPKYKTLPYSRDEHRLIPTKIDTFAAVYHRMPVSIYLPACNI
jgi:hypothetical protein